MLKKWVVMTGRTGWASPEYPKKGKGNMTNIFVSQVLAFPLYYPSERIRESINQEISDSLLKQAAIKNDIAKLRSEIDGIIDALVQ